MEFLSTSDDDFEPRFQALLSAKREDAPDVDDAVAAIIAQVRAEGDAALRELTARFDRLELGALAFTADEIDAECAKVPLAEAAALELAAERIRAYHLRQLPENARWTDPSGAELGWRWTPVS
ncbi:MAG: histidinol dehydrogenase, partial [Pseudomonadota bacterium]